jgi:hypothetical protein|tara:strand:+ start:335 stop:661 length:327 start_codon:yes stop_codon:yes gene_type:complete
MIDMGNQSPTMHVDYYENATIGCEIITFWNYQLRSRENNGTAAGVLEISLEHGKIERVTYFDSESEYYAADGWGKHNMSLTKAESLVRRWVVMACSRQRRLEEEAEVV